MVAPLPRAQRKISNWTAKIQRIEDQPYLDQARLPASNGNLPAIAAAQQISSGRALSNEAQAAINDWESQLRARRDWRMARRLALQGTPDALAEAISLAQRVPATSPLRVSVNPAIEQWSQQMLRIAVDRGKYDIPSAIALAKQIQLVPRPTKQRKSKLSCGSCFSTLVLGFPAPLIPNRSRFAPQSELSS